MKSLFFLSLLALPSAYAHKPRLDDLLAPHHDYCRDFLRIKPSITTKYTTRTVTLVEKKTKHIHPVTLTKTRTVTVHHGKTTLRLPDTTLSKIETFTPDVKTITSTELSTVHVDITQTTTSTTTTGGQQKRRKRSAPSIAKEKRHLRVPDLRGYKSSEIKSCCERILKKKPKWVKTVTKTRTVTRKTTTTKTIRDHKPTRTVEIKKYITLPSKTVTLQQTKKSTSTITVDAGRTDTTVVTTPTTIENITTSTRIISVPQVQPDRAESICGAGQSARSFEPQDPSKITLVTIPGLGDYGRCLTTCRNNPDCIAWRMSSRTTDDCNLFLVNRSEDDDLSPCELDTMDRTPYKFDFVPAWFGDEAHQSGDFFCVGGVWPTTCERPELIQLDTPKPKSVYCPNSGEEASSFVFDSAANGHKLGQEIAESRENGESLTPRQCSVYCGERGDCAAYEWSWNGGTLTNGLLWGTCKVYIATGDERSTLTCPDLRAHAFSYEKTEENTHCVGRGACGPPRIYDKGIPPFSCSHGIPIVNFNPEFDWESQLAVSELLGISVDECHNECASAPETCVVWRWDQYYGGACYIYGRGSGTTCQALSGVPFSYIEDFTRNERCLGMGACGPPEFHLEPM